MIVHSGFMISSTSRLLGQLRLFLIPCYAKAPNTVIPIHYKAKDKKSQARNDIARKQRM